MRASAARDTLRSPLHHRTQGVCLPCLPIYFPDTLPLRFTFSIAVYKYRTSGSAVESIKKRPHPPPHQKMRGQWSNDQGNQQMSTPPSRWTFENRFMTFSLQLNNSQEVSIPTTFSISRGHSCRLPPALPVARLGFLSCKRVRHSYSSSMWLVHRNCTIYLRDVLS